RDGHEVIFVTASNGTPVNNTKIDGYQVIRRGNRFSVYWRTYRYVMRNLADWPDLVIEEVNTVPFFSRFYLKHKGRLFFHMLGRKIWFYQLPLPASILGYSLEPLYLRLLSRDPAVAMSSSTKQDLQRYGFRADQVSVISEGIQLQPIAEAQ